jgi:hypothetical protein
MIADARFTETKVKVSKIQEVFDKFLCSLQGSLMKGILIAFLVSMARWNHSHPSRTEV